MTEHTSLRETWVLSLGWEDPLEKGCKRCRFDPWQEDPLEEGMATHSSILAWRIPWTEESAGLQRKRCRDPRCSPRGNPACRGTFGGRRKAVRATCASDLRKLLSVPLRSQGHSGVGRGLSELHWVWCNGRPKSPPTRRVPPRGHRLHATRLLCPWGFSRQEYWSGFHALLQGIFLPGIEPASLASPALAGRFFTTRSTWEAHLAYNESKNA